MSQSNLEASFIKITHCQIYSKIALDNLAIIINDKIVIIVEDSKDIDHAIINAFETANATAIVLLIQNKTNFENIKTLLKSTFDNIVFYYCSINITDSNAITSVFYSICATFEELTVLILFAVYLHSLKPELDLPKEELNRIFEINFKANVYFVRQFFDSKKQYSQQKIIINVSIVAAYTQQPNMLAYDVSKATLVH